MPPPSRAAGIMFSGRPSVRPSVLDPNSHFSDSTWPHWSNPLTVCFFSHVRPSVHPSGLVSRHFRENAWRNRPVIWHDGVSWLPSELIRLWLRSVDFPFWRIFFLVKRVKFEVSGHYLENARRDWPVIWHADVSWPPSELIRAWLWSLDFPPFGAILT